MIHDGFECDIYFIRHGESESNIVEGLAAGRNYDAPMTPRGFEQARALGERLKAEGVSFDRVYVSSLTRAVQTAETMLETMGAASVQYEKVDEIIELQVPGWRGRPREEIYTPAVEYLRASKGKWFVPGDGESERAVERRFSNWLEDEIIFNPEYLAGGRRTVAIVSHGLALRCLFHYILGYEDRFIRRIQLDNACISRFKFAPTGWFPISINDAAHTNHVGDVNREGGTSITP